MHVAPVTNTNKFISGTKPIHAIVRNIIKIYTVYYIYVTQVVNINTVIMFKVHKKVL